MAYLVFVAELLTAVSQGKEQFPVGGCNVEAGWEDRACTPCASAGTVAGHAPMAL